MQHLHFDLENCYGIRKLRHTLDFTAGHVWAIYAPNGCMKTSFANTLKDISEGIETHDKVFPNRVSKRIVLDDLQQPVPGEVILVLPPYADTFGRAERTSTLLVDPKLRSEYEALHADIDSAKSVFLKAMKEQSGSKKDLEREISLTFTRSEDRFYIALSRISEELLSQKDAPFASVPYDTIFEERVLALLASADFKTALQGYIERYNELLTASKYFKKGIFNFYNASTIAKALADNGYFDAHHTLQLNSESALPISTVKQLEDLISAERAQISSDKALRKQYAEVEKQLSKNAALRDFERYLSQNEALIPRLANIEAFRDELWKSYIKARFDVYSDLLTKYRSAESRKREIEEDARKQRTQWERVIDIFNARFSVPFKLSARNRELVILGQEPLLSLGFTFEDGADSVGIGRDELMQVLSNGERKALYVLSILFELEVRKATQQTTLVIVDDIADSFDYKNKYAIVQYLKEIGDLGNFYQIILTHNFDFFRTIESRGVVPYPHCLLALRDRDGVTLEQATGIRNVFVRNWKGHFFDNARKRLASIPFLRNLIEYTRGPDDPSFLKLTSLLHWKLDSAGIAQKELDSIFRELFGTALQFPGPDTPVLELLGREAADCLQAPVGMNFENKIVLAIASRVQAERFMVERIGEPDLVQGLSSNQTQQLLDRFAQRFPGEAENLGVLHRVQLMTPESIHLNSFMYEPIVDMSDEHLRALYRDTRALH